MNGFRWVVAPLFLCVGMVLCGAPSRAASTASFRSIAAAPRHSAGSSSSRPTDRPANAPTLPYSGIELYEGIFFGVGPAAAALPEIWQNPLPAVPVELQNVATLVATLRSRADSLGATGDTTNAKVVRNIANALAISNPPPDLSPHALTNPTIRTAMENDIARADPTFFGRFAAEIQSGNPLQVAAALHEATTRTYDEVDPASPGLELESQVAVDANFVLWSDAVVAAYAVLAANVAVVVSYALAAVVAFIAVLPILGPTDSHLAFDALVQLFASRFALSTSVPASGDTGILLLLLALLVTGTVFVLRFAQQRVRGR